LINYPFREDFLLISTGSYRLHKSSTQQFGWRIPTQDQCKITECTFLKILDIRTCSHAIIRPPLFPPRFSIHPVVVFLRLAAVAAVVVAAAPWKLTMTGDSTSFDPPVAVVVAAVSVVTVEAGTSSVTQLKSVVVAAAAAVVAAAKALIRCLAVMPIAAAVALGEKKRKVVLLLTSLFVMLAAIETVVAVAVGRQEMTSLIPNDESQLMQREMVDSNHSITTKAQAQLESAPVVAIELLLEEHWPDVASRSPVGQLLLCRWLVPEKAFEKEPALVQVVVVKRELPVVVAAAVVVSDSHLEE
jgi:hypothetical protein